MQAIIIIIIIVTILRVESLLLAWRQGGWWRLWCGGVGQAWGCGTVGRRWASWGQELKAWAWEGVCRVVRGPPDRSRGRWDRAGELGGPDHEGTCRSLQTGIWVKFFSKNQASPQRSRRSDLVKISCLRPGFPGDQVFYPKNEIQLLLSQAISQIKASRKQAFSNFYLIRLWNWVEGAGVAAVCFSWQRGMNKQWRISF